MSAGRSIRATLLDTAALAALAVALAACPGSKQSPPPAPQVHTYNGTAAVGDFITLTVDRAAATISFHNWTTGNAGLLPFTVDADGALVVTQGDGELRKAYEIPGFALVAEDQKAKDGTQLSLVFAFEQVATSASDFQDLSLAFLQFRTADGGVELGCGTVDGLGVFTIADYLPIGVLWPPALTSDAAPIGDALSPDAATGTLVMPADHEGGIPAHVFRTASGAWIIDAEMGSVLLFPSATTAALASTAAGTYYAVGYRKAGESTAVTVPAAGTASFFAGPVTLSSAGELADPAGAVQLRPLREAYAGTALDTPACDGLFAFTPTGGGEGFAFVYGDAVFFSTFRITDPVAHVYDYSYGVALRR
jgi:hypothetical protein